MSLFRLLKIYLVVVLLAVVFGGGFYFGRQNAVLNPTGLKVESEAQNHEELDLGLFWETLDLLRKHYIDQEKLRPQELVYGAVSGMVASLGDPYTAFYTPENNTQFKEGMEGIYEGIGAQLGFKDHQLVIVAPLSGSPAQQAGVLAGDEIWAVDGESTAGWSLPKAVSKIRGEAGTTVTLALRRIGSKGEARTFETEIGRERISVPSILIKWVGPGKKIAHLEVLRFGPDTKKQWQKVVDELLAAGAKGVILDVRNNPGGFLDAAVFMGSEFFRDGIVVQREYADGKVENFEVDHRARLDKIPLAVLLNSGSASASEIVSCAIQVRGRGQLVGTTSFGKGTIQEAIDLKEGAGIHITSARWLCPDGSSIDKKGLEPDVMIKRSEEEIKAGIDLQLEKAVELLQSQPQ